MTDTNISVRLDLERSEIVDIMLGAARYIAHKRDRFRGEEIKCARRKIMLLNKMFSIIDLVPIDKEIVILAFPDSDIYEFQAEIHDLIMTHLWEPYLAGNSVDQEESRGLITSLSRVFERINASIESHEYYRKEAEKYGHQGTTEPNGMVLHLHIDPKDIYYQAISRGKVVWESSHYPNDRIDARERAEEDCKRYAKKHDLIIDTTVSLIAYDYK